MDGRDVGGKLENLCPGIRKGDVFTEFITVFRDATKTMLKK